MDKKTLDLERFEHPNDAYFTIFKPENTPQFVYKMQQLAKMLENKYLYLSDEYRDPQTISTILTNYVAPTQCVNMFYEMGDFQGLIGFTHVIPGYKSGLLFKIWDKEFFDKGLVRALRGLLDFVQDSLDLKRISVESPDPRMVKGAELIGFEVEGEEEYGFRWKGKFFKNVLLGRIQEENGGM